MHRKALVKVSVLKNNLCTQEYILYVCKIFFFATVIKEYFVSIRYAAYVCSVLYTVRRLDSIKPHPIFSVV